MLLRSKLVSIAAVCVAATATGIGLYRYTQRNKRTSSSPNNRVWPSRRNRRDHSRVSSQELNDESNGVPLNLQSLSSANEELNSLVGTAVTPSHSSLNCLSWRWLFGQ